MYRRKTSADEIKCSDRTIKESNFEAIALLWQENGTLNLIYEGVYFFQKEDNWSSMIMNAKRGLGVGVI